jgi:hypothetical protein
MDPTLDNLSLFGSLSPPPINIMPGGAIPSGAPPSGPQFGGIAGAIQNLLNGGQQQAGQSGQPQQPPQQQGGNNNNNANNNLMAMAMKMLQPQQMLGSLQPMNLSPSSMGMLRGF